MCFRYYMEMSPRLRPIVEAAARSRLYRDNVEKIARPLVTEGEVFPDSLVPVIASSKAGKKAVFPMLWGYHADGIARVIANARAETAAENADVAPMIVESVPAGTGEDHKAIQSKEDHSMKKTVKIEGMMCQMCVKHVKAALTALDPEVEVSLENKCATLGAEVSDDAIRAAVADAGYEVVGIE